MRSNKHLLIGLLAFVGLSAGLLSALWFEGDLRASKSVSQTLSVRPDFELQDLQGHLQNVEQWNDSVVVINFWATWCPPCRKEIPELVAVQDHLRSQGVQLLGVAIDEHQPVLEYMQEQPFNYPVLMAPRRGVALSKAYGNDVGALPFTVVIDRQQRVQFRHAGPITGVELEAVLRPLLTNKVL